MCSLQCDILDLDGEYGPLYRPVPSRHGIPGMQNLHFCFRGEGWSFPGEDGDWHMLHMIQCHIPDWSTIACADQSAARATRKAFLDTYVDRDVTIIPSHFPNPTAGFIVPNGDAFAFRYVGE